MCAIGAHPDCQKGREITMNRLTVFGVIAIISAGVAGAHSNVQNAAVKARMDAMSGIAAEMKTLGQMAKGATAFNRGSARAAATAIAAHAAATPGLFMAEETDPKSEAKASIWVHFEDFAAKAGAMENAALGLSNSIDSTDDLGPAMQALGATCKSCHTTYRQ